MAIRNFSIGGQSIPTEVLETFNHKSIPKTLTLEILKENKHFLQILFDKQNYKKMDVDGNLMFALNTDEVMSGTYTVKSNGVYKDGVLLSNTFTDENIEDIINSIYGVDNVEDRSLYTQDVIIAKYNELDSTNLDNLYNLYDYTTSNAHGYTMTYISPNNPLRPTTTSIDSIVLESSTNEDTVYTKQDSIDDLMPKDLRLPISATNGITLDGFKQHIMSTTITVDTEDTLPIFRDTLARGTWLPSEELMTLKTLTDIVNSRGFQMCVETDMRKGAWYRTFVLENDTPTYTDWVRLDVYQDVTTDKEKARTNKMLYLHTDGHLYKEIEDPYDNTKTIIVRETCDKHMESDNVARNLILSSSFNSSPMVINGNLANIPQDNTVSNAKEFPLTDDGEISNLIYENVSNVAGYGSYVLSLNTSYNTPLIDIVDEQMTLPIPTERLHSVMRYSNKNVFEKDYRIKLYGYDTQKYSKGGSSATTVKYGEDGVASYCSASNMTISTLGKYYSGYLVRKNDKTEWYVSTNNQRRLFGNWYGTGSNTANYPDNSYVIPEDNIILRSDDNAMVITMHRDGTYSNSPVLYTNGGYVYTGDGSYEDGTNHSYYQTYLLKFDDEIDGFEGAVQCNQSGWFYLSSNGVLYRHSNSDYVSYNVEAKSNYAMNIMGRDFTDSKIVNVSQFMAPGHTYVMNSYGETIILGNHPSYAYDTTRDLFHAVDDTFDMLSTIMINSYHRDYSDAQHVYGLGKYVANSLFNLSGTTNDFIFTDGNKAISRNVYGNTDCVLNRSIKYIRSPYGLESLDSIGTILI